LELRDADIGVINPSVAAGSITGSAMITTEIFGAGLVGLHFALGQRVVVP